MREILFRGEWTETGDWVKGFYVRLYDEKDNESHRIYPGYAETDCGNYYPDWYEVDPNTVGQFTGLTDKNGKKIFDGDILAIARKMDGMGTYYVPSLACPVNVEVKWDFCGWMWETLCPDKRYLHFPESWCHFECEVIGNIHDNPELLEGKNV